MKYASALLARLRMTLKDDEAEAFDLRLRRIEQREAKCSANQTLFRNRPIRQAA